MALTGGGGAGTGGAGGAVGVGTRLSCPQNNHIRAQLQQAFRQAFRKHLPFCILLDHTPPPRAVRAAAPTAPTAGARGAEADEAGARVGVAHGAALSILPRLGAKGS